MKAALPILALLLAACATRNERYTYLVDPQVGDEQLAALRARDPRISVRISADGSRRFLASARPVEDIGARVAPISGSATATTGDDGQLLIGIIQCLVDHANR
jgi:hypothetical protein